MACTPTNCTNNCYSNVCTNNRASCASNRIVSLSNVVAGNIIGADIEILRSATFDELTRWNLNPTFNFPKTAVNPQVSGNLITALEFNKLINDLSSTGHGTTANVSAGAIITASKLASDMLTLYNSLRTDCVCNSDCGANSICACHGNCGCNYSDERLKINIEYI